MPISATGVKRLPPWAVAGLLLAIPVGTYSWMLYTRPNIYEEIANEIKRQEAAEMRERAARGAACKSSLPV